MLSRDSNFDDTKLQKGKPISEYLVDKVISESRQGLIENNANQNYSDQEDEELNSQDILKVKKFKGKFNKKGSITISENEKNNMKSSFKIDEINVHKNNIIESKNESTINNEKDVEINSIPLKSEIDENNIDSNHNKQTINTYNTYNAFDEQPIKPAKNNAYLSEYPDILQEGENKTESKQNKIPKKIKVEKKSKPIEEQLNSKNNDDIKDDKDLTKDEKEKTDVKNSKFRKLFKPNTDKAEKKDVSFELVMSKILSAD